MMKKFLTILTVLGSLALVGCNEQQLIEGAVVYRTIQAPEILYSCPKKPPRPTAAGGKIMDSQVAEFIVRLDNAHSVCSRSIQALKAFATQAQLTVEKNNPKK